MNSNSRYTPGGASYHATDPSLLEDEQWTSPESQIALHGNIASNGALGETIPSTSYDYTVAPSDRSVYSGPYQNQYSQLYSPGGFDGGLHGQPLVTNPTSQASFSGSGGYQYSQFGADPPTISPQALQKSAYTGLATSGAQIHSSASYQNNIGDLRQNNNSAPTYIYQNSQPNDASAFRPSSSAFATGSSNLGGSQFQGNQAPRNVSTRQPEQAQPHPSLRITRPDLLTAANLDPNLLLPGARYAVVGAPIELDSNLPGLKQSRPKKIEDKKSLPPGVGKRTGSTTPAVSQKTVKSRPLVASSKMKSTQIQSQPKQMVVGGAKSSDSPPSNEDSSSEYESSSQEEVDEKKSKIVDDDALPVHVEQLSDVRVDMRPIDAAEAAAWDATGIIFVPRHRSARLEEIVKATQGFEKYFVKLREELMSITADLATADAEKRLDDSKRLKEARSTKRSVISSAVQATIKNGHETILKNLGKSQKTVNALVAVLRDSVKSKDLDGELPRAILDLLSRCNFISDELLQKVKFDALEKRLNMVNNVEIKRYIDTIHSNITQSQERAKVALQESLKTEKVKAAAVTPELPKARKADAASKASSTSSLKRPHEQDTTSARPTKKTTSDATAIGTGQKGLAPKVRQTAIFESMKRPASRHVAAVKAAASAPPAKMPDPKPMNTPVPQMSFSEIMASIERPKEAPKVPDAPAGPPESVEEKAKRERKESRRHLRVRWKDGDALEEVRLFRHELAEDEGRQDGLLRDAHDDRSEGMMLKQRVLDTMADEEEEPAGEIEFRPYPELALIDASVMDQKESESFVVTRLGKVPVNSLQQQVQQERESLVLMVVYTDPKDIPYSPKEPPPDNSGRRDTEQVWSLGQAATWLPQRIQQVQQYGPLAWETSFVSVSPPSPLVDANHSRKINTTKGMGHAEDINSSPKGYQQTSAYPQSGNTAFTQSSHQHLSRQQQTFQQQTFQQFTSQPSQQQNHIMAEENRRKADEAFANLERLIAPIKGLPYPAEKPNDWMSDNLKDEWWRGYNRDKATAERKAAETRAAQSQAAPTMSSQWQQQMSAPQIQPSSNQHYQTQHSQLRQPETQYPQLQQHHTTSYSVPPNKIDVPEVDVDKLQNILAALNAHQNNNTPTQVQSSTASTQLQNIFANLNQGQNSQAFSQQPWNGVWPTTVNTSTSSGQSYPTQNQQPTRWDNGWSNSNANENTRTTYGENQWAKHETQNQDTSKTRARDGGHGGDERHRASSSNDYKRGTKPCKFWQEGKCAKGANCTFLHE